MAIIGTALQGAILNAGDYGASSSVTLDASGVAALSGAGYYKLDTYGAAASDDCVKLTGLTEGETVVLQITNAYRSITIKHGDYIKCEYDFALNNIYDKAMLICEGSDLCSALMLMSNGAALDPIADMLAVVSIGSYPDPTSTAEERAIAAATYGLLKSL